MTEPLFDEALLALRKQRAHRKGPALFLAERACEDLIDRLSLIQRRFRRGLFIGLPVPDWSQRFMPAVEEVVCLATLGELVTVEPASFDLCVVLGQLDVSNDLPLVLQVIHAALESGGLAIGAFAGNESLPALRSAMLSADKATGQGVSPRIHPRVEASSFSALLQAAGFTMPVVDIDRVRLRYRCFDDAVADLRAMAATNVLLTRSRRPLGRAALAAAREAFNQQGDGAVTVETIELIHFAAWAQSR